MSNSVLARIATSARSAKTVGALVCHNCKIGAGVELPTVGYVAVGKCSAIARAPVGTGQRAVTVLTRV